MVEDCDFLANRSELFNIPKLKGLNKSVTGFGPPAFMSRDRAAEPCFLCYTSTQADRKFW